MVEKLMNINLIKTFHYSTGCFRFINSLQMALITMEDCFHYTKDTVVPRVRKEFPNLTCTLGYDAWHIEFVRTQWYKGLGKYNGMCFWVEPEIQRNQGEREEMIISGRLIFLDKPKCCEFRCGEFQWDDLNAMIDRIRELEGNECCNVCVLM